VLDIATGGGDIPIALWRRARRRELAISLAGCDLSPRAIQFAREKAKRVGAKVDFFEQDVIAEPLPDGFDAVICSLFLHHLSDEDVVRMLAQMAEASRQLVAVNDLRRSTPALMFAYAATRVLTRSDVVRVDGPLSVRAAFTVDEVKSLAREARLDHCEVSRRWPFRFVLSWWRDDHL